MGGLLTPYHIIGISIILLGIFVYSVILIARNEKDMTRFLWILLAILIPFFGSLIYILVHHARPKLN